MKSFFKNVLFLFGLGFIVNIITWALIYYKIRPNADIIPLHYNVFYGIDFADKGYKIYYIPAIGLSILLLDYIFSRYALKRDPFAAKTVAAVGLVVQLVLFLAIIFLKSIIYI